MADTDIIVSEMTPASQINTGDLMIMTQPDAQAETGYTTKSGTVLQVANKQLKGIDFPTDLPSFGTPNVLGGLEELKADIKALLPIGSASGNPCTFETDLSDKLVSLTADIVAKGGGGTPATPIPIVGHSELNLVRCGKNFFNTDNAEIGTAWNGSSNTARARLVIPCVPNTTYYISSSGTNNLDYWFVKTSPVVPASDVGTTISGNMSITTGANDKYIIFAFNKTDIAKSDIEALQAQLELGSSSSAYAPYNGQTFTVSLGQTVYGGRLYFENGWKCDVTHKIVDMGDLIWSYAPAGYFYATPFPDSAKPNINNNTTPNMLCSVATPDTPNRVYAGSSDNIITNTATSPSSIWIRDNSYTDVATYKTAMTGQKIAYELATPIEIDVSELSVDTIVGENNIVSDCGGDVEVQYRDSIQHYIDKKIAETQALIL